MANKKKNQIKIIILIIVLIILGFIILSSYIFKEKSPELILWASYLQKQYVEDEDKITNFDECINAGNIILETYPRKCRTISGKEFIEDIGNQLAKLDLIVIDNVVPNQKISSPLRITGQARGYWYFEAEFSIEIVDSNNKQLGIAIAFAKDEWMTENFVPFESILEFESAQTSKGYLIIHKSNPSDLPENEDQVIIPIVFE